MAFVHENVKPHCTDPQHRRCIFAIVYVLILESRTGHAIPLSIQPLIGESSFTHNQSDFSNKMRGTVWRTKLNCTLQTSQLQRTHNRVQV